MIVPDKPWRSHGFDIDSFLQQPVDVSLPERERFPAPCTIRKEQPEGSVITAILPDIHGFLLLAGSSLKSICPNIGILLKQFEDVIIKAGELIAFQCEARFLTALLWLFSFPCSERLGIGFRISESIRDCRPSEAHREAMESRIYLPVPWGWVIPRAMNKAQKK